MKPWSKFQTHTYILKGNNNCSADVNGIKSACQPTLTTKKKQIMHLLVARCTCLFCWLLYLCSVHECSPWIFDISIQCSQFIGQRFKGPLQKQNSLAQIIVEREKKSIQQGRESDSKEADLEIKLTASTCL